MTDTFKTFQYLIPLGQRMLISAIPLMHKRRWYSNLPWLLQLFLAFLVLLATYVPFCLALF